MTVMLDDDEDDCLCIDEDRPASPETQTADDQNSSPGNTGPECNNTTSDLRNVRKNPEPPLVNYLPLMRNFTLDKIKNNMLNSSDWKPKITIRDFARIPDGTNSNENTGAELAQHTANPTDNALIAEAQNNDPRVHVEETWVSANLNAYNRATTATDYERASRSYAGTLEDQRLPIPQNSFVVQNANIPHMPSAPSMKGSVIIPNPGIHSGGEMTYRPPPPIQGHNGIHANVPTAITSVWPVQNGRQAQMYPAYNRQYGNNSATPAEYNEQATAKYNQGAPPPKSCPPGCYCRHQMNMSAHSSNPPPARDPRLPPYMYPMGTINGQRLASTNPHERVPVPNSQHFPWNGFGQAYGTNPLPPNSPYHGRDTPAYFAEMNKQAYLQRNSYRMESMRIKQSLHVSASAHVKERPGVKTSNKRAYTKVGTNNTQIVINTNSEIPENLTHNTLMGDGIGLNMPNLANLMLNNAFGTEEITSRQRNTSKNTKTTKAKASIPVNRQEHALSNMGIPTRNIIPPCIDLTSASAEHNMNNIPYLTQPPLNTDAHLTTMSTKTPEANIATVSHYIDVDKVEPPMTKEGNLQPTTMNISNDGAQHVLMEAPQSVVNLNINRDTAQIPLNMNQQGDISLNIVKAYVKTSMLNNEGNLATLDKPRTAETLLTSAFIQSTNNNTMVDGIQRQIALNLLNNNNNITQIDATSTPKTLVQASSNAYEVKVSKVPTTTPTERISHNIENNAVLTSATMNTETDSFQGVARENSILKTVDNRTETIVTTVGVVNNIPGISIQTLKDILNNAQKISTKTASNDDHTYDNQVSKCDDNENYTDAKKMISNATADDHSEARIDHEPDVMIVSKQDKKLEIARTNLARLRAEEHENSSRKHVEKITQRDTENQYQIKITTGLNGEYITQVTSVSSDRSSVEQDHFQVDYSTSNTEQINAKCNENVPHSQRRQETEVLDGNRSIENNQEIKETSEPRENLTNISRYEAQLNIDETIFFKFQINFFRLVQERLSENNCLELAAELSKDIHDLIAISDDERAKADMKYKCHVCRNIAIYSPRSLYYEVTSRLEECLDKTRNCPLCITFRKKYIDILIKYIEIEAPEEALNSRTNSNAAQRDDATINSSNECQPHLENSVPIQEDGLRMDSRQDEYSDLENQLCLLTNGVPSSPKKAKIDDQAGASAKHDLDVSKTNQDSNTNAFVVKLPWNRLKESTVKALMQCKTVKSNAVQATLNIGLDDNSNKANTNSENRELRKNINTETITSTFTEQRFTTVNNSTNNSNESDNTLEVGTIIDAAINNSLKLRKSISTEDTKGTNSAAQNRNSNPASEYIQDSDKNKEKHRKKRITETSTTNQISENKSRPLNDGNTDTNQARRHKIRKSISVETVSTTNPTNPNNNDHIEENQEKHRKRKSISSAYPEPQKKITNDITTRTNAPHSSTDTLNVASNNKENHNNIQRETTDTSSRSSKANTSSDATSTETTNKSISENLPETTADIVEKDDTSRSDEKRENSEKIHNDDTLNDARQPPRDNQDESGDNATQSVEKALSDCQNTIKKNCISNEEELPQVELNGKKPKNKNTKSKDPQPLTEITYEYRCSECTVGFKYLSSCLSHMTKNHNIQNPVVPLYCITMGCAFCDLFVMPKLYNNHIKTAHKDKFTKDSQKVEH